MKKKKFILLIEDDLLDVRRFERALSDLGFSIPVVVAQNQEEARCILDNKDLLPYLIVIDLNTPGEDGVDFLLYLKGSVWLKVIPVIVLTGSESDDAILQCYHHSVAGYVLKSPDYPVFVENMKTVISYWEMSESPVYNDGCITSCHFHHA